MVAPGNHESCARGGQGWWRFLDPRPLLAGRDCNDAANDMQGNFSDPYAMPLGGGAQLIVLDTLATPYKGLAAADPRMAKYGDDYRKIEELSRKAPYNIAVDDHPLFAFGPKRNKADEVKLFNSDKDLQDAYGVVDASLMPKGVKVMLSGNLHLWEQVSFSSEHPTQFVSGFSGTAEDIVPLPEPLPPKGSPAPGAVVASISSWVDGFGFMTMERPSADAWTVKVWDTSGALRNTCAITGSKSLCEIAHIR